MAPNFKKRFWEEARVTRVDGGFSITLDQYSLPTPLQAPFVVPQLEIATMIAQEWNAQTGDINPRKMPATRMSNAAIDKIIPNKAAIIDMLYEYGESDLLCYRATSSQGLIDMQARYWDPILQWLEQDIGAPMRVINGIMPIQQDPRSLEILRRYLFNANPFQLAAVYDLVTLSGSLILAIAIMTNYLDARRAWRASCVDELWQEKIWGIDKDAQHIRNQKEKDFMFAVKFYYSASYSNEFISPAGASIL